MFSTLNLLKLFHNPLSCRRAFHHILIVLERAEICRGTYQNYILLLISIGRFYSTNTHNSQSNPSIINRVHYISKSFLMYQVGLMQMDIIFMQQRNSRRKRKDPESRDFTCRCGKGYLSYAAAYTHVKNKHQLDKTFLEDIGKPQRDKLPRGRPKDKKNNFSNAQIEELSILEETTLKFYQLLSAKFDRMILQGNDQLSEAQLEDHYRELLHPHRDKKINMSTRDGSEYARFERDFSRHFSLEVAGRVKVAVRVIEAGREQGQITEDLLKELNAMQLWRGENTVNLLLVQTFQRWRQIQQQA